MFGNLQRVVTPVKKFVNEKFSAVGSIRLHEHVYSQFRLYGLRIYGLFGHMVRFLLVPFVNGYKVKYIGGRRPQLIRCTSG